MDDMKDLATVIGFVAFGVLWLALALFLTKTSMGAFILLSLFGVIL
ncbi:hypothetical protein [Acinetobacter baumannii]